MSCPKCGCKVTYSINGMDDADDDYEKEKCSACYTIFYSMDAEDEDDSCDEQPGNYMINGGKG